MNNKKSNEYFSFEEDEKLYTLTKKQLQNLLDSQRSLYIAEEQKRKSQCQLDKVIQQNNYVFVEVQNKSIIQKIAKSICGIIEWKWSIEKDNNIIKRNMTEFHRQIDLEIARNKGLID